MFYVKSAVVISDFFLWLKNSGNNLMCEEVGKLWFYRLFLLFILSILITLVLFGVSLMAKYCKVDISQKLMTKSTPVPLMPIEQGTLFTKTKGKKFKKNSHQSKAANSAKNQEKLLLLEQNEENKEEFSFEDEQDFTTPLESEKSAIVENKTRTAFKNKCYKMKKNFSKILKSRKMKQRAMSEDHIPVESQVGDENLSNLSLNEENGPENLLKKFRGKKGKLVKMNAIMMKSTMDLAALFKNSDE